MELHDWVRVRDVAVVENLPQARTHSMRASVARETITAGSVGPSQTVRSRASPKSQPQSAATLMWAAACRRYDLIGEFAEEVLRERFLTLASVPLTYEDYDSLHRARPVARRVGCGDRPVV